MILENVLIPSTRKALFEPITTNFNEAPMRHTAQFVNGMHCLLSPMGCFAWGWSILLHEYE